VAAKKDAESIRSSSSSISEDNELECEEEVLVVTPAPEPAGRWQRVRTRTKLVAAFFATQGFSKSLSPAAAKADRVAVGDREDRESSCCCSEDGGYESEDVDAGTV
jgi:hypothetical protein